MGSEIVRAAENSGRLEFSVPVSVTADNLEELVRGELGRIGESFLRLGYYFEQAKNCKLYVPLGYDSVFELAEDLFDLKESSVYDMMAVWRWFHSIRDPLSLRDDCKGLKYSQLVECLRDRRSGGVVTRVISATDTVRETRAKVTAWNYLVDKISGYPSREEVENEVERQKMRKEREEAERENSRRLENSAPELAGQLPGQTSLFVEGYVEEPTEEIEEPNENSRRLENLEAEKFQTSGKTEEDEGVTEIKTAEKVDETEEDPFGGLPKETAIYAEKLLKDARAKSNAIEPCEEIPADIQMRVHKRQTVSYIEIIAMAKDAEGVDRFFDNAIKRLVAMRAYKLLSLQQEEKK